MMEVIVNINGKRVARLVAVNVSNLEDVSDYDYFIEEGYNPDMNIPKLSLANRITGYSRKQSAWKLVERILKDVHNG